MAYRRATNRRGALRVRKSYKRKRWTRRVRRPRRGRGYGSTRMAKMGGFPTSIIVKMRYAESFSINPASTGLASEYNFCANGVYDPNLTGGGHQPMGFDQWSTNYNHYRVLGSRITIRPILDSTTSPTPPVYAGVQLQDTTGRLTTKDIDFLMEQKGIAGGGFGILHMVNREPKAVSAKFSARKFFANSTDQDMNAPVTSNPVEQAIFTCYALGAYSGIDPPAVYFQATIDYIVKFYEPRPLGQS